LTPEEAEARLLSLELFGMRFGLDRMRRLMTTLQHPERSFKSIHVVGTNGKSSTTRMIAAILACHGIKTGSYLSPHLVSFAERIRIEDQDISAQQFAEALERAFTAADRVNRSAAPDDHVTQFELLTAAAYDELARQNVEAAVIEAGLGGRYDATNVIPSSVQVLTGIGLEHTRWLGPTVEAIAREKLDVVKPGATLVLGSGMHPDATAVANEVAQERNAQIAALMESWPELTAGVSGRKVAVVSILDDKDAAGMLAELAPRCDVIVLTASQNPRALPPPTLVSLLDQLDGPPTETLRDPQAALKRGREIAGPDGLVVATGSIYLIADLLTATQPNSVRRASML